jgi:ribose 1,5-bisphosphokinase
LLTVDHDVLRQRLLARGRESLTEVEARLDRNARFTGNLLSSNPSVLMLDNSRDLQQTVAALITLLSRQPACV